MSDKGSYRSRAGTLVGVLHEPRDRVGGGLGVIVEDERITGASLTHDVGEDQVLVGTKAATTPTAQDRGGQLVNALREIKPGG